METASKINMANRNINKSSNNLHTASQEGLANCYDSYTKKHITIDFVSLGFSKQLACAYALSYYTSRSDASATSHRGNKLLLNQIARFHKDLEIHKLSDITTAKINSAIAWLKKPNAENVENRSLSYMYGIYTLYKTIIKNIPLDHSKINSEIRWPANPFPYKNKSHQSATIPTKETYESLYNIMLKEYLFYHERLKIGREVREGKNNTRTPLTAAILDLVANESRFFKGTYPVAQSASHTLIRKAGGLPNVVTYLYPTRMYVAPIYQMILMKSGANPTSIVELETNCIQPIPLVSNHANIKIKKRRGYQIYTTQLSKKGRHSPIAILESLISQINYLQRKGITKSKNVFQDISLYSNKRRAGPIDDYAVFKPRLRKLAKENNIPLHSLKAWRSYHLTNVYKETEDILKVKSEANHSDIRVTKKYIDNSISSQRIKTSLVTLTNEHLASIRKRGSANFEGKLTKRSNRKTSFAASYGMNCKNPLEGKAAGSTEGELCPGFLRCFTCKNSIIPINRNTCTRLIQLRDHLKESQSSLNEERWEIIYKPIYSIVENQILINFPKAMRTKCSIEASSLSPLPRLT